MTNRYEIFNGKTKKLHTNQETVHNVLTRMYGKDYNKKLSNWGVAGDGEIARYHHFIIYRR
jgi:hypothetical protein